MDCRIGFLLRMWKLQCYQVVVVLVFVVSFDIVSFAFQRIRYTVYLELKQKNTVWYFVLLPLCLYIGRPVVCILLCSYLISCNFFFFFTFMLLTLSAIFILLICCMYVTCIRIHGKNVISLHFNGIGWWFLLVNTADICNDIIEQKCQPGVLLDLNVCITNYFRVDHLLANWRHLIWQTVIQYLQPNI